EPWQFWALSLTVLFGTLLGQSVGYLLGKYFGPRLLATKLGQRLGEKQWKRAANFIDRRGGIAVFISRFLPILHSLTPVTVGMSNMSYRRFISWATPAAAIWAFGYSAIGMLAKNTYRALAQQLHFAGYIFVAIIVLFLAGIWLAKHILAKRNERDMELPGDGDTLTKD
ncbi:MAG: DedA family protein, partial [Microbacteriaceae bacterium]